MPPDLERLHLLTLAVEEALSQEDWQGAGALLQERDRAISRLEGTRFSHEGRALLDQVAESESRIVGLLSERRRDVLEDMGQAHAGRRMIQAYRAA